MMGQYSYRIRFADGHVTPWADWNSTPRQELENKTAGRERTIKMGGMNPTMNPQPVGQAINVEYQLPLRPPGMVTA